MTTDHLSTTAPSIQVGKVENYLYFDGRCEEALEFYRRALGAEILFILRFKEAPVPSCPEGGPQIPGDKIMHASFKIGETTLMASDGRCGGNPVFQGFGLSIGTRTEAETEQIFAALAEGGTVQMALHKTFFSPLFGMLVDRFGVNWTVRVEHTTP
jgi:PhnB protein